MSRKVTDRVKCPMMLIACLLLLSGMYAVTVIILADYMRTKPVVEKLGYVPQAEVLKFISADQKLFVANSLVMKALFYFGSLVEKNEKKLSVPPDYYSVYKTIETAVKLDPYNMDGYYFAQAIFAWDAQRVKEANALLLHGQKYRTWDYQIPFFLGFNYAYFLKDYGNAATYYRRAAELSGETLLINLAGRYLQESGQTDLALAYMSTMEKGARNAAVKKEFQVRLTAFREVKRIETALAECRKTLGPSAQVTIDDLVKGGFLRPMPVDPYGGRFYIDQQGQVKTTSKFSFFKGKAAVPPTSRNN